MDALNIVFAGTPDFAAGHLQALIDSRHNVVGVYSQPDRPAGRGKKLQPSPVKKLALEHEIAVFQPLNFKQEGSIEELEALNADIMIVVAYGLLLPLAVLEAPKMGCLNVHASILPRWRGAAPIQRAIQVGDTETGITIMQMDVGLDTGDMLSKTLLDIKADETGGSLHDRLLEKGPTALLQTLTLLQAGEAVAEKQDDTLANYAHKLSKEEALINWSLPAIDIELNVRAFNPFPCAYTLLGDQRIKVWQALALEEATTLLPGTIARVSTEGVDIATGAGLVRLLNVQLAGKKAMAIADVVNGQPNLFQPQHMFASQA
ncbi:methionyl-tRNA formyltransferase [Oleispira antarctica]|uniref:Methionyl-tRNA formyltransferase n=1 Tax=Oleispira antarctica TaxID=188908 RepID=A0A1Y5HSF8_OLEAN|nr:methionyl-tRNA formyltransferase [Oleispira antarctica]